MIGERVDQFKSPWLQTSKFIYYSVRGARNIPVNI